MRRFLGRETLATLHRESRVLDVCTLVIVPSMSVMIVVICGMYDHFLVLGAVLAQGWLFQWFGLINHEFFVHRQVGGPKGAPLIALVFTIPIFLSFTRYRYAHKLHHRFVGSCRDSEGYKQDINTRLKRLLFCTYIGVAWAASGRMGKGRTPYFHLGEADRDTIRRAKVEAALQLLFCCLVVWLWIEFPQAVTLGYIIPVLVVLPTLNALRILFEHAELQPENSYFIASRFRCSLLEELAFLWDAGEFHLIHHYFPNIPFYRMRAARRAINAFFDMRQIPPTSGRMRLLYAWFIDQRPHRTWWQSRVKFRGTT